jgi:hypothetical protein
MGYQEKSYPGEIVPKRTRTPKIGYDFSWRSRTQVRFLQEKSYPGTTSPGEIVLNNIRVRVLLENLYPPNVGYDFSSEKTLSFSVNKSWVRLLLRKTLPFLVTKSWVRVLLKKTLPFSVTKSWVRVLLREKKTRHLQQ